MEKNMVITITGHIGSILSFLTNQRAVLGVSRRLLGALVNHRPLLMTRPLMTGILLPFPIVDIILYWE